MPDYDHRRAQPLPPGSLVVRHVEESGTRARDYDFGELPIPEPLRRTLAELFAGRVGPDGIWRQLVTSREIWIFVVQFSRFLADRSEPVNDIEDIRAAIWSAWRLSRPSNEGGRRAVSKIQALLRDHPRLPAETRELMVKRVSVRRAEEKAYTSEEFERIKTLAGKKFRSALLRIRDNQRLLEQWQAGVLTKSSEQERIGEALNCLALTGGLEVYRGRSGRIRPRSGQGAALGGANAESTWKRLFLDSEEAAALVVLMVATYGWNVTTVAELQMPEAAPDTGEDGHVIYRMELQKRRRNNPHRYETRNLTDFGANSPGRLITQAIEATAPARATLAALGTPRNDLILWRLGTHNRHGLFRAGFRQQATLSWREELQIDGLSARRLRKTVTVGKRVPIQHSQDVHDSVYVLPDPRTAADAAAVIAEGINEAVQIAHTAFAARISRNDVEPPAGTTGDGAASNVVETVTAGCTNYAASPFTGAGVPCRASFLLCTACPNAVVTPSHLPRLAYLLHVLSGLASVLPAAIWDADWRAHYQRLLELRGRPEFTDIEWDDALAQCTARERETIDALLNRGFDE
ncbi:hypothetical protein [Actinocorallia aurantiaca]|uniref:hypothetical protein n=1 Tax=Actinocorallia aurantiaca TaxID=46204 RepID=UPI0031E138E8